MGLISPTVLGVLASKYGVDERRVEEMLREAVNDVSRMLRRFVRARQYSFVDRLANAAGREAVAAALYESLRIRARYAAVILLAVLRHHQAMATPSERLNELAERKWFKGRDSLSALSSIVSSALGCQARA